MNSVPASPSACQLACPKANNLTVPWHCPQGPPLVGRRAVRDYMARRLTPDRVGYTCEKTLRTLNGNVFGVQWENRWTDRDTGKKIRTRGIEIWVMRGEQVARWDGAVNAWEE